MQIASIFALSLSVSANAYTEEVSREYKIKAAYLYNLIKFVNWPEANEQQLLEQNVQAINICVFPDSPFLDYLDVLAERKVKGRAIQIQYINKQSKLGSCNILYLSKQNKNISALLANTVERAVLTVGENPEFLDEGGIIGLVINDNNIKLQINLTQAKKVGLEMSGNLLEIAKNIQ